MMKEDDAVLMHRQTARKTSCPSVMPIRSSVAKKSTSYAKEGQTDQPNSCSPRKARKSTHLRIETASKAKKSTCQEKQAFTVSIPNAPDKVYIRKYKSEDEEITDVNLQKTKKSTSGSQNVFAKGMKVAKKTTTQVQGMISNSSDPVCSINCKSENGEIIAVPSQKAKKQTGGSQNVYAKGTKVAKKTTTQFQDMLSNHSDLGSGTLIDATVPLSQRNMDHLEKNKLPNFQIARYIPHTCSPLCAKNENLNNDLGKNPLLLPVLSGWSRLIAQYRVDRKPVTFYRSPCGRRLRNLEELSEYLWITKSQLTIDLFCFDSFVHIFSHFTPKGDVCMTDITGGNDTVPVYCINTLDEQFPPYFKYCTQRIPSKDIPLNLDTDFLCSCDCEDNCQSYTKCQCQQLTFTATEALPSARTTHAGYKFRRLMEPLVTGIYECNSKCKCGSTCTNRVVQNGLNVCLQVFKTENKGWGVRSLDDLPQGMFICIYSGELLTEQEVNEDEDKYLAELDHIEVVEKLKEGYENDVMYSNGSEDENDSVSSNSVSLIEEKSTASEMDFSDKDSEHSDSILIIDSDSSDVEVIEDIKRPGPTSDAKKQVVLDQTDELPDLTEDIDSRQTLQSSHLSVVDNKKPPSLRNYYHEENCYVIDSKRCGNVARFFNHSCCPNVFVQNVFVDTHDPRFPWVAFFAKSYIRAGTELTWDYSYKVGSVPGREIYCFCGSSNCRGRLL